MDQVVKKKWLKALRSGRYKQAHRFIYSPTHEAFCCLGVLGIVQRCDVRGIKKKQTCTLPEPFNAGLNSQARGELAEMNDRGKSFKEIADYIERHY